MLILTNKNNANVKLDAQMIAKRGIDVLIQVDKNIIEKASDVFDIDINRKYLSDLMQCINSTSIKFNLRTVDSIKFNIKRDLNKVSVIHDDKVIDEFTIIL